MNLSSTLRICLYVAMVLLQLPLIAQAQPDSMILKGVTFPCNNCLILSNGNCELEIKDSPHIVPCGDAFEEFLDYARRTPAYSKLLSIAELRNALLQEKLTSKQIYRLFFVISQLPTGQALIRKHAWEFLDKHPQAVYALALKGLLDKETLQALWEKTSVRGNELLELRALIAHQLEELDLSALVRAVSTLDIKQTEADLRTIHQVMVDVGSPWAEELRLAIDATALCSMTETGALLETCTKEKLRSLSKPISQVLLRVHTSFILSHIEKTTQQESILIWLNRMDYENSRTPKSHDIVSSLIQHAVISPTFANLLFEKQYSSLLETFSTNDKKIARELATLYLVAAERQLTDSNESAAVSYIQKSFDLYPGVLQARNEHFRQLYADNAHNKRLEKLLNVSLGEMRIKKLTATPVHIKWLQLGATLLVMITALLIWVSRKRRQRELEKVAQLKESNQSILSNMELYRLLKEFNLSSHANANDLKAAFRRKAMIVHPDAKTGDVHEFVSLKNKFERATFLMNGSNGS